MATISNQLKDRTWWCLLFTLVLGLLLPIAAISAKEPSLKELRDQWTKRMEASSLPDSSFEKYELKISTMAELLARTDSKHLEIYVREAAAAKPLERDIKYAVLPKVLEESQEFARAELLRKCLEESHDAPPTLLLLTTAPPDSVRYRQVEHFLALKMGPDGMELLLQAAKQTQDELAKERLFAMLRRAFPGFREKHSDNVRFLEACSQWLTENKSKVKIADVYYPMNPITSGKRPIAKETTPDCTLFVSLQATEHSGP
ncbi:hypothetical protein DES53_104444 [Roseimicrobium gellanilyticum]|uniref:Uncharacterized protein n=1 Tax=Roseimicrobium gellanilyticum TaxID=748857 RepID=A0A366HN64_9BACT|nr:hypothetical protein [Roseimicrobium gellanilyticum]RBP44622.1 hypothetical protein DES53_104444 [Roseimicrobium gellanilyticum]